MEFSNNIVKGQHTNNQKLLEVILKTILSDVNQKTLVKVFFACFTDKYFENIKLTIKILQDNNIFCSFTLVELLININLKIILTNSNLQPILINLVRINEIANFLNKMLNSVKTADILNGPNLFEILIFKNFNIYNIVEILNIEEVFIYITNKEKFYYNKQKVLHYLVLKEVFHFISKRLNSEFRIKKLLQQIENLNIYNKLLDDIFKLFFLQSSQFTSSIRSRNFNYLHYHKKNSIKKEHSKFICTSSELKKILSVLNVNILERLNKCEHSVSNKKLLKYNKHIKEILYTLVLLNVELFSKSLPSFEDSEFLIQYSNIFDLSGSDEETCILNDQIITKRKTRLQKKNKSQKFFYDLNSSNRFEEESVISILLSNKVEIAKYNLAFGYIENTCNIINDYKLNNFELENELNLIQISKLYSQKVELNLKNFHIENEDLSSNFMVQRIRNIAGYGFEISSVIHIINEFICLIEMKQFIKYNEGIIIKLIKDKSCLFLKQYRPQHCNMVFTSDLLLNLNVGHEMYTYILNLIGRNVHLLDIREYGKVGYFSFLNTITESIRILKSTLSRNDVFTLQTFLIYTFPFDDTKIQSSLNRFIKFNQQNQINKKVTIKDISLMEIFFEKSSTNYFKQINYFIQNFINLINFKNTNCEYDVNLLFITEPRNIIEKIIYNNNNVSFLKLEKKFNLLNLHLVYLLIELITPTFFNSEYLTKNFTSKLFQINSERYLPLLHYISDKCPLLERLFYKNIYKENLEGFPFLNKIMKLKIASTLFGKQSKNLFTTILVIDYLNEIDLNSSENILLRYMVYNQLKERNPNKFNVILSICANQLIFNDIKYILILESICCIKEKSILLINNYRQIDDVVVLCELLNSILLDRDIKKLSDIIFSQIKGIKSEIEIYYKIYKYLNLKTWKEAYNLDKSSPIKIFESLIYSAKFELLKQWAKLAGIYKNISKRKFIHINMEDLLDSDKLLISEFSDIIENFPIEFVSSVTKKCNNFNLIFNVFKSFVENSEKYFRNYKISSKILIKMKKKNLKINLCMLSKPLLLIEQLIMNSQFQVLSEILKEIDEFLSQKTCHYCLEKIGNKNLLVLNTDLSYETILESGANSDFILLNLNLDRENHILTSSCIDLLLRIYASRALDFDISKKSTNFCKTISMSIDGISIDSLTNPFEMPKIIPNKIEWIKNDDARLCQSCHYTVFTMLIRRHHCRRCDRVVCYACSKHRMKIPELCENVNVPVCIDCVKEFEIHVDEIKKMKYKIENIEIYKCDNLLKWQLNGNLTHDKTIREQFCYEHACDIALCLTILSLHKNKDKCIGFLLYHCKKLKHLIALGNPEVNFNLIAKILGCLSLAAKMRGGPSECEDIQEHADIINSLTKNGCEQMIPELFNENTMKRLIYSLLDAENWKLSLDISFKYGIFKCNIFATQGLLYLKSGYLELAREKFNCCMTSMCSFTDGERIFKALLFPSIINVENFKVINRPKRSPRLLSQIIRFIESTDNMLLLLQKEKDKNALYNSSTSYSLKCVTANEAALNIFNTLSSLESITSDLNFYDNNNKLNTKTETFKECFYYIIRYGTHADIIQHLLQFKYIRAALQYFVLQNIKNEYFVINVFFKFLKIGEVAILVKHMLDFDNNLLIWRNVFSCICKYLESKHLFNSLYQLQVLLKDPVRASITCIKLFLKNCNTFKQLNDNVSHLNNAKKHLEAEMELFQNWENINFDRTTHFETLFPMQLDFKSLNAYLNAILLQKEVAKFLAKYEELPLYISKQISELQMKSPQKCLLSLFGSTDEKVIIAVFLLLLGQNINDGFGLSYRIIQEFQLNSTLVYSKVAQFLIENNRVEEVFMLCDCIIANNNTKESAKEVDEVVLDVIKNYNKYSKLSLKQKSLIKVVKNIEIQISCYVKIEQLENAYLLAIQHKRFDQVKIILERAKQLKRFDIEKVCEKKLQMIT